MKSLLLLVTAFLTIGFASAQDSTKAAAPRSPAPADTARPPAKGQLKVQRKKGKVFEREKPERRRFDSTLFPNNTIATRSDYMESMERIYDMLSQVPAVTATFVHLDEIDDKLDDE